MVTKILIDADLLAFRASSAVQKDIHWGNGLWTCHSFVEDAIDQFNTILDKVLEDLNVEIEDCIFCFSDSVNFRKLLFPEYKANRQEHRKPTCYNGLVEYIWDTFDGLCRMFPNCEGDDCISILATTYVSKGKEVIIVSADKDFETVPNVIFYNFLKETRKEISSELAGKNLLVQTISGDRADNYMGVPGYGKVLAERYIDKHGVSFDTAINLFESKGLTEQSFWVNYRQAKLLDFTEYDYEHQCIDFNIGTVRVHIDKDGTVTKR